MWLPRARQRDVVFLSPYYEPSVLEFDYTKLESGWESYKDLLLVVSVNGIGGSFLPGEFLNNVFHKRVCVAVPMIILSRFWCYVDPLNNQGSPIAPKQGCTRNWFPNLGKGLEKWSHFMMTPYIKELLGCEKFGVIVPVSFHVEENYFQSQEF